MDYLSNTIIFNDSDEETRAVEEFDKAGEDYDWDSGDRMMTTDTGLNLLDTCGFDYEIV